MIRAASHGAAGRPSTLSDLCASSLTSRRGCVRQWRVAHAASGCARQAPGQLCRGSRWGRNEAAISARLPQGAAGPSGALAKLPPVETLTIAEAAEATGLTKKAIRNRVDRGQLKAVLRDGVRHIPLSELDRAGLATTTPEAGMGQEATSRQPQEAGGWTELLSRLERQASELAELRQLTREAESLQADRTRLEEAFHQERAEKQAAEQRIAQLANAGWRERRRLLRELRQED